MKRYLAFSLAWGLALAAYADGSASVRSSGKPAQHIVEGSVSDASGPLAGATVRQVGASTSAQTDERGHFRIQAPVGGMLRFSAVGYLSQDVEIGSGRLSIVLEMDEGLLDQVVVVGYGTQKKTHLTGAVSVVDAGEVFGNRPIPDAARGLQGVVPGLNIVVPDAEIGSDPRIKIRGQIGSMAGGNDPLILVDNVEIPSLQHVNPADIESFTILKDAASASIYGAKAAFGVILITTKQGAKDREPSVSYANNFIWQSPTKTIDVAGVDGLQYSLDAHKNMKQAGPAGGFWRIDDASMLKIREWQEKYGDKVKPGDPVVYGRDWWWDGTQKFGYRIYDPVAAMVKDNAFSHRHNLGLSGTTGGTDYNIGMGFLGQNGMMKPAKHDDFTRFNPSLSLRSKVNDFLSVRGKVLYSDGTKRNPVSLYVDGFAADPWLYLYRWSRLFPVGVQENGQDIIEPAFSAASSNTASANEKFLNLSFGAAIDFTKNWNLQADYAFSNKTDAYFSSVPYVRAKTHWYGVENQTDENGNQVFVDDEGNVVTSGGMPAYQFPMTDYVLPDNTYVSQSTRRAERHTFNAYSTYNLDLAGGHNLKLMLGTNITAYEWKSHSSRRRNLMNGDNPQFNFATGTETAGGDFDWDAQAGFFGRFNYAFRDRYLFEANLRHDGTSKFPKHLQWQWYPSVSAGWVASNERFMEAVRPVLSFAKFRTSWGSIGDQNVPNSLYLPRMTIGKNSWLTGSGEQVFQLSTPPPVTGNMEWQRIEHFNIGADLRFFKNRLGLTAEWYRRNTLNMIIPGDAMPDTYGATAPRGNYGDLSTKGWEIALDYF